MQIVPCQNLFSGKKEKYHLPVVSWISPESGKGYHIAGLKTKIIQIYWKFYHFQIKNSAIFIVSAENIDCRYSLEPPRWGGF